jgi:hypothetical protein
MPSDINIFTDKMPPSIYKKIPSQNCPKSNPSSPVSPGVQLGVEHGDMHVIRENIADGLMGDV